MSAVWMNQHILCPTLSTTTELSPMWPEYHEELTGSLQLKLSPTIIYRSTNISMELPNLTSYTC